MSPGPFIARDEEIRGLAPMSQVGTDRPLVRTPPSAMFWLVDARVSRKTSDIFRSTVWMQRRLQVIRAYWTIETYA